MTAVLAACVLGWSASADARPLVGDGGAIAAALDPDTRVVVYDGRDGEAERSSIREVQPAPVSDSSRAERTNGNASAAFIAAFVLAGVAAVLVAAASRVSSG